MLGPSIRIVTGLAGVAAIAGLACLPSIATAWRHGTEVWGAWRTGFLLSPAFWIWLWATWLAVSLPWSLVGRALPLIGSPEATPRFLAKTLSAFTVIAMGIAVFWQFVAWSAFPLLAGKDIRMIPFWPWPAGRFTDWVLGP